MALSTDDMWYPTRVSRNNLNADQKQWEQQFNRHLSSLKAIYEREPPYHTYFRPHKNTRTKNQFRIQYERLLLQQQIERLLKRGHCVQMPSSVNASAFGMSVASAIDIRNKLANSLLKMAEASTKARKKAAKKGTIGHCEQQLQKTTKIKKPPNRSRANSIYPVRQNIVSRKNSQHRADSLTRLSRHSIHNAYKNEMENSIKARRMSSNSKIGRSIKASPMSKFNYHSTGAPLYRQAKTNGTGSGTDLTTRFQVESENITRCLTPPRTLSKSSSHPHIKQKHVTLKRTDSMCATSSKSKPGRKGKFKHKHVKSQSEGKKRSQTDVKKDNNIEKTKKSLSATENGKSGSTSSKTQPWESNSGEKTAKKKESANLQELEKVQVEDVRPLEVVQGVESIEVEISSPAQVVAKGDPKDLAAITQGVNDHIAVEDKNNNGKFTISGSSITSFENIRCPASGKLIGAENVMENELRILSPVRKPTRVFEDIAKEAQVKRSKTRQVESNIDICDGPEFRTLEKKNRWDQDFLGDIDLDFERAAINTRNTYLKSRTDKTHVLDLCRRCFDIYNTHPDALLCERCEELVRSKMPPPPAIVKSHPPEIIEIHSAPYCRTQAYDNMYQSMSEPFYAQNVYIVEEDDLMMIA